jgi:flagellar protein FlaJ
MAEKKLPNLLKKIQIPRILLPTKVQRDLDLLLAKADISFSAREWVGIFTSFALLLFLLGALIHTLLTGFLLFAAVLAMMGMVPKLRADKRRTALEEALPDALHHMAVSIRTGLVLESVIQEVSNAEYGALSDEFSQIVIEMRRGRSLREALIAFSLRSGSKQVERAMRLLLEGVEAGGPISDVLDEVSEDLRAVRTVQRERKSLTSQQISFLAMASLMAGPFVMGVVASLPRVMAQVAGPTGGAEFPLEEIQGVVTALTFYVIAQAFSAALMMGVVMFGDYKKGFRYSIPMILVAYTVFAVVRTIMPSVVSIF